MIVSNIQNRYLNKNSHNVNIKRTDLDLKHLLWIQNKLLLSWGKIAVPKSGHGYLVFTTETDIPW